MKPIIIITMILMGSMANAQMSLKNGSGIHEACSKGTDFASGFCLGYVAGSFDAVDFSKIACIPAGVTTGQVRDVVKQFMTNNPSLRHFSASSLIKEAIRVAFSCK